MSMLKKAIRKITGQTVQIFSDEDFIHQSRSIDMLLKQMGTPAPTVETPDMVAEADIRLPRMPVNQRLFYEMRWNSVILRMICLKLKQEIFRETMKEGFEWEPTFKAKCGSCGKELQESPKQCIYCQSTNLIPPDPAQKFLWEKWLINANKAEQTLLEILQELEDDLNTADDLYLVCIKDYLVSPEGELTGKLKEIMRGDPATFRIVGDITGRRGGKYFVCPLHREENVAEQAGQCGWTDPKTQRVCGLKLHDVHYVETETGGKTALQYYIAGEVIHTSKYEPSRLYGISPVFTLWINARTLILMDRYAENLFEKGRLKGVLAVMSDNPKAIKKWWSQTQDRLRKDPHYLPLVAISSDENKGRVEFIKLMDSLKETEASEYKKELRINIAALYGISPIFQADVSTGGGLQNEGLQITVTDRAVDHGQAIYHNKIFPKLCQFLGITDWKPKLRPSREMDEMAELQRMDQKVITAEKMLQLGFDVKFEDEKFMFSGEVKQKEESLGPGQGPGQLPQREPPKQLPARVGEGQPEPENRQGQKHCPPGKVSTPENPRCHPAEWDRNKQKALQKASKPQLERQVNETKKKMRASEIKMHAAAGRYGKNSKEYQLFQEQLKQQQYLLAQLESELSKAAFQTSLASYFNPIYSLEEEEVDKGYGPDPSPGSINAGKRLKVFDMERQNDESGISGTGLVASGIVFPDGKVVLRWNSEMASTTEFDSYEDFKNIHVKSHPNNKTKLHYYNLDEGEIEEFKKSRGLKKSGDMMAHFGCIANKMQKAGIEYPKTLKVPRGFRDWVKQQNDATRQRIAKMESLCNSAGSSSSGERDSDYPYPYPEPVKKAVESGRAVDAETQQIENRFLQQMEKSLVSDIISKIKDILGKGTVSKLLLFKLITEILSKAEGKMEQLAFNEILKAYQEGKEMVSEEGKLEKTEAAPRFAMQEIFDFSKGDQQALRAIFEENPFWGSFQNMNKETSDKLKAIIEESYEPVNSARMEATIRDVLAEYKEKGKSITKAHAESIAYNRIGKFDLAKTIEMMKRTVQDNVYHLERIVRTETTGITAKGREMAMQERDKSGSYRYDWFGPMDKRTSDVCKDIQKQVLNRGQGRGLPLEELKAVMKDVGKELNPKWGYREWVPHANCRRVLRRVS